VGGIKDITRTYFERMATPNGLPPGNYDLVYAGTGAARLSALVSGSVDAAILGPPFNFKAEAANFTRLPPPADFAKGVPFSAISANTAWAKTHLPLVTKFLAAYSKAVDWFYQPGNREEAVDILAKKLSLERQEAERIYEFYTSIKAFDRSGPITKDSIGALLEVLKAQGDIEDSIEFSRFYDPSVIAVVQ
jgi:ABC-type nitrate/sulfonate/bicarbonate transport system substrate-binding protein